MSTIRESIDVHVPVRTAYNQWTQFEEFPRFMEGVEQVRQVSDSYLEWTAEMLGQRRTWAARITEQEPDRKIAWVATEGEDIAGTVTFEPVGDDASRVHLEMRYEPQDTAEKVGDAMKLVERRTKGDLQRFKEFIEARGTETGAWRGEIPPDGSAIAS
ncbi:MAG TPA: SRPBCC family protein [Actinomycetota bacterium]|nr:SRPBCC family protein [Actinomycetota bacterium]